MTQEQLNQMTHSQKVDSIVKYYNDHFKWQKLVYDQEIDRKKVEAMTTEQIDNFIINNCK